MKKLAPIGLVLSISVALMACSDKSETVETPEEEAPQTEVAANEVATDATAEEEVVAEFTPFLADAAALQKAEDSLKALPQFEGKPLNLFQNVNFYDGEGSARIELDVQDPNKAENVDHYTYQAETVSWSEPQPVQISGGGDMTGNLTSLEDFNFADVATMVIPMWHEKAKEADFKPNEASPSLVSMILVVPSQDHFWQSQMENERSSYILRVNLDGSLKSFEKN